MEMCPSCRGWVQYPDQHLYLQQDIPNPNSHLPTHLGHSPTKKSSCFPSVLEMMLWGCSLPQQQPRSQFKGWKLDPGWLGAS